MLVGEITFLAHIMKGLGSPVLGLLVYLWERKVNVPYRQRCISQMPHTIEENTVIQYLRLLAWNQGSDTESTNEYIHTASIFKEGVGGGG